MLGQLQYCGNSPKNSASRKETNKGISTKFLGELQSTTAPHREMNRGELEKKKKKKKTKEKVWRTTPL